MPKTNPSLLTLQNSDLLRRANLFSAMSEEILNEISVEFQHIPLTGGESLFKQEDIGDAFYVVVYGLMRSTCKNENNTQTVLGEHGAGSVIGEIACLLDRPRSATVYAVRDSLLLKLTKDKFDLFMQKYPMAMMSMVKQSIGQLISGGKHNNKTIATSFTLIPAGTFSNIEQFSIEFVKKLSKYGETFLITEELVNSLHGEGAALFTSNNNKNTNVLAWLHSVEINNRFVVYQAKKVNEWAERCIRQADKIILVGEHGESPQINQLEKKIYVGKGGSLLRTDAKLVLIAKPHIKTVSNTRDWLVARTVSDHFNLRYGNDADFNRFIRIISGNAIGLVLSGGGGPALAHIGTIRALEELNIRIDYIGGTSMGAIIGACLAYEMDSYTITEVLRRLLTDFSENLDFTLPMKAFLKAKKLQTLLQDFYGEDTRIEDLWRKFFCVSTNINQNKLTIHNSQQVWSSIRKSISLPAIFPATNDENDTHYVDGGILNNLPVDIMQKYIEGGKIIASSLNDENALNSSYEFEEDTVSGWYLFIKHYFLHGILNEQMLKRKSFMNIFKVIHHSMIIGSHRHQEEMKEKANYNIVIEPEDTRLLNFSDIYKTVDKGYQQAMSILSQTDLILPPKK